MILYTVPAFWVQRHKMYPHTAPLFGNTNPITDPLLTCISRNASLEVTVIRHKMSSCETCDRIVSASTLRRPCVLIGAKWTLFAAFLWTEPPWPIFRQSRNSVPFINEQQCCSTLPTFYTFYELLATCEYHLSEGKRAVPIVWFHSTIPTIFPPCWRRKYRDLAATNGSINCLSSYFQISTCSV